MTWSFGLFETMTEAYPQLIRAVLERGDEVAPDGKPTWELLDCCFSIEDVVTGGVPIRLGRKVGVKPMAIDGLGNLSGWAWPSVILATGPFMERFADRLTVHDSELVRCRSGSRLGEYFFQGTYGPRMAEQLRQVEAELRSDPHSRRAVVNVWDSRTDYVRRYRDRPCTTQLQFLFRGGALDLFVTMRSNDLWTGTCYDVWQFGQVLQAMAHVLGMEVGRYHHRAISLHAYVSDEHKLREITGQEVPNAREDPGPDWGVLERWPRTYKSMEEVQTAFGLIGFLLACGEVPDPGNSVERWYVQNLKPAPQEVVHP